MAVPPAPSTDTPGIRSGIVFSVAGFPVRVRLEFLLVAALFGSAGSPSAQELLSWIAVVFVSVLFHELGHALVGRMLGCDAAIELYGMGGVTHLARRTGVGRPISWLGEVGISLAGPAFGFALGGAVALASSRVPALQHGGAATAVTYLLWANVGWSVMNLAPILPYDGGLALRAVLVRFSPTRGARWSHMSTVALGTAAVVASLSTRSLWLAYLAARGVIGSWQALRFDGSLEEAWKQWDAGAYPEARAAAVRAGGAARGSILQRALATELSILASLAARDAVGAKVAFDSYPEGAVPSPLLRAIVALDSEDRAGAAKLLGSVSEPLLARVFFPLVTSWGGTPWEERAAAWLDATTVEALPMPITDAIGERLYRRGCFALSRQVLELRFARAHGPRDAYNVACCCTRQGEPEVALTWLARALDAGWTDLAAMDSDDDLEAARALDGYAGLRAHPGLKSGAA